MDENTIINFLQKKLDKAERKQFMQWLQEDRAHFDLYSSIKKAWALSAMHYENESLDPDLEFRRFKYRNFGTKANKVLTPFQNLLKIAALFIFAFGTSFFAYTLIFKDSAIPQDGFNEITTRAGEKTQVTLADGSKIWVNSCTHLRYNVNILKKETDLYLEGEAFFDFKKIPNRTITVHTSKINIKVLGTAFNLKSYTDDNIIETTLVRGQIAIEESSGRKKSEKQVLLQPNQSAIYFINSKKINVQNIVEQRIKGSKSFEEVVLLANKNQSNLIIEEQVDTEPQISWKDGKLSFRNESFELLAKKLERWFAVKISINDDTLKKARFTGTFDKETIEQALKALSYPVPFNYKIVKDSVFIKSN